MKDLIVVVADGYQEKVLEALLERIPISSRTVAFSFDIIKHPEHDSGCYNNSHELLRSSISQYRFALVIFDFEGTGVEHFTVEKIENDVHLKLDRNGWESRNIVIVINPELENWMWIDNQNVEDAIGWDKTESLYDWARNSELIPPEGYKPLRPKESMERALKICETSKSTSIYKKIATNASYRRCVDPALLKLVQQLQIWFPHPRY
jgi:hypothetical protein